MNDRPNIDNCSDGKTFRSYYYLKEELTTFCRKVGLQTTGGKIELTIGLPSILIPVKKQS